MATSELRDRLVLQSLDIIAELGHHTLTLRELGTRAGVSRQAPYLHFSSKQELLATVAAEVMRRERKLMQEALKESGANPRKRLHALALAHVRFLKRHPKLYELVYGGGIKKAQTDELQAEAAATFTLVRETLGSCFTKPDLNQLRRRCIVLWGAIRGIAELELYDQVPASIPGKLNDWLREAIDTLLDGWGAA